MNPKLNLASTTDSSTDILLSIINSPRDIIIFSLDKEYRYLAFNENHKKEMKTIYNADIEISMNMLDVINIPLVRAAAKVSFDRVLLGDTFCETIEQQGIAVWYEFNWSPLKDNAGNIIGITAFIQNVTARKNAEQEVLKTHMLLSSSIESQKNMIILALDNNYQYLFFNTTHKAAMKQSYNVDVTNGMNILDCITSIDDRNRLKVNYDLALLGTSHSTIERYGDIVHSYYETFFSPIYDADNQIFGLTAIAIDISDKKNSEEKNIQLQDELRQAHKLEALGRLAGGVAHDFNNLLSGIMGSAELIQLHIAQESEIRTYTDRILNASSMAADLTAKLLKFSRKGALSIVNVDVHQCIKNAMGLLQHIKDGNVEIVLCCNALDFCIEGDGTEIENSFLNIAINARDAMPEGGTLTFTTTTVTLTSDSALQKRSHLKEGHYITIQITDTGTGMDEETKRQIFEPFFTTKEKGKGTGLGLASVYGCVHQHKGFIDVASTLGQGTTFTIYLPLVNAPCFMLPQMEASVLGNGKIMIVDDDVIAGQTCADLVKTLGYLPMLFNDPQQACSYFESNHSSVAAVILDMIMPKINGLGVYKLLKATNPHIPVVIASGYSDMSLQDQVKREGATIFIQKPFKRYDLSIALRNAIGLTS